MSDKEEWEGRDRHKDLWTIQAYPPSFVNNKGAIFLELFCKQTDSRNLHELGRRKARELGVALLEAADYIDNH